MLVLRSEAVCALGALGAATPDGTRAYSVAREARCAGSSSPSPRCWPGSQSWAAVAAGRRPSARTTVPSRSRQATGSGSSSPANPGVGDDWSLAQEPDPSVAVLVADGFESDAAEDVVGAEEPSTSSSRRRRREPPRSSSSTAIAAAAAPRTPDARSPRALRGGRLLGALGRQNRIGSRARRIGAPRTGRTSSVRRRRGFRTATGSARAKRSAAQPSSSRRSRRSQPGSDRRRRSPGSPSTIRRALSSRSPSACTRRELEVRERQIGARGKRIHRGTSAWRASTSTPFAPRVRERRLDRGRIAVDGDHGREAELGGGDREHARPAAEIERRSPDRTRAAARGRAGSSGERPVPNALPGVDDDRGGVRRRRRPRAGRPRGGRREPGRWKSRQRVLPAGADLLRHDVAERSLQPRPRRPAHVDGELELAPPCSAPPSHRRQLGQPGAGPASARSGRNTRTETRTQLGPVSGTPPGSGRRTRRSRRVGLAVGRSRRTPRAGGAARRRAGAGRARSRAPGGRRGRDPGGRGIPLPRRTRISPGCVPGSSSSSTSPSSVGIDRRRPERRLGHREVDRRHDVVAVPHEARVRRDAHGDVRVACPAPGLARVTLAGEANALPVVDARRDPDLEPALDRPTRPAPSHASQSFVTILPPPWQREQTCARDELPEHRLRDLLHPAGAAAAGARLGLDPGRAPLPRHVGRTWRRPRTTPRASLRGRPRRARSRPRRRRRRHAAAPRAAMPPKRSSPKNAESRSERLAKSKSVGRKPAGAQALVSVAVVELPRLGLREHLVGLGDLAEPLLGVRVVGDVGMQLPRERAERLLDLVARRRPAGTPRTS